MPPSFAMWRNLPPWQNLNNGAIVSIWSCMAGFHCCSLGLHTPTCKLARQPVPPEVPRCPHNNSGQFWLTALPLAIIFSILLVSIAAQDFMVVDTAPRTQLELPLDQRIQIGFPLGTSISSSWSAVTGNLGRFLDFRLWTFNTDGNNHSTSTRPAKVSLHGSTPGRSFEAEPEQVDLEQSRESELDDSRLDVAAPSESMTQAIEDEPRSQGHRQPNNEEEFKENPPLSRQESTKPELPKFRKLISLPNKTCPGANQCKNVDCGHGSQGSLCSERLVHIAMTLDVNYLRGSMAAIYSILLHAECPSNIRFHFVATKGKEELEKVVAEALPFLQFQTYTFDEKSVKSRISHAVRHALEEPLNYARFYLAHMIDPCVKRIIYLDSDVLVLDRIEELWMTDMGNSTVGTPEYCHANFPSYFTENFWTNSSLSSTFANKRPCYFNSGVMVINLDRWRKTECTATLEYWMEVQKEQHIYDLGSLPPLLLTFAGDIQPIDNRWNQHGLGGDILKGDCRPPRNEPASLLHWSGGGKPWQRLDIQQPCPVDSIWVPYDLLEPTH